MNSILFTIPILFMFFAVFPISTVTATCTATVRVGSRGECVREVQRAIGVPADGIFGPDTNAAVKQFQSRHGLGVDGIVGPATWAAIHRGSGGASSNSATCSATVRVGSRGECVREVQRAIGVPADGIFGPDTNAAVKQFQSRHGLGVDGIVGPATWAAIHRGSGGASSNSGNLNNLDSIIAHMEFTEGFRTQGYIPTSGSGVTVGFGIDLGQQSLDNLSGVPASIVAKVKPYLGLKTRTAVANAGLRASNLQLTDQEAKDLSKPFIKKSADIAAEYGTKMSQKGRNVLASLRHWAGSLGCTSCRKLAPSGTNHVWNAIKNKEGTDAGLRGALDRTLPGQTRGTAAYNRIKKEIDYLN